jgi:hypothetical protein
MPDVLLSIADIVKMKSTEKSRRNRAPTSAEELCDSAPPVKGKKKYCHFDTEERKATLLR